MLYTNTVADRTLEILKEFCAIKELQDFFLVGGTNLSLRYGHRMSIDLDFFCISEFDNEVVIQIMESNFPSFSYKNNQNPIGVFGFIDDIKIDLVRHHYFKQISSSELIEGIRLFGVRDIIAMKSVAILKRGVKKDFWDISELLQTYTVKDFIEVYKEKYPNNSIPISLPYALTYFADADDSEDPVCLKGLTWDQVKSNIQKAVRDYLA